MAKQRKPSWYRILEACRVLDKEGAGITAFTLSSVADLSPQICSGWLSKFARWGYIVRGGRGKTEESKRWVQYFELTEWGRKKRPPKKTLF